LELRFHAFLVVLLITRKCHNSLENHGRNEHHTSHLFHLHVHKGFLKQLLGARAPFVFCNVTTSSRKQHPQGFHNSQSNALHMTLLHPPHPPSLYHNDVYSIGSRLRVPGSSREPPALSLSIYIYTHCVCVSIHNANFFGRQPCLFLLICWFIHLSIVLKMQFLFVGITGEKEVQSGLSA